MFVRPSLNQCAVEIELSFFQASNVMIWHVPNSIEVKDFSAKSFLKYYTTNDFLQNYGGTLKNLFANYAPLKHSGMFIGSTNVSVMLKHSMCQICYFPPCINIPLHVMGKGGKIHKDSYYAVLLKDNVV